MELSAAITIKLFYNTRPLEFEFNSVMSNQKSAQHVYNLVQLLGVREHRPTRFAHQHTRASLLCYDAYRSSP